MSLYQKNDNHKNTFMIYFNILACMKTIKENIFILEAFKHIYTITLKNKFAYFSCFP